MNTGRKQTRLVQNRIGTTALGVPCSICFKFVVVAPVLALLFRNIPFCMSSAINLVCTPRWRGGARGLVCSWSFTALFCWRSEGKPSPPPPLLAPFPVQLCYIRKEVLVRILTMLCKANWHLLFGAMFMQCNCLCIKTFNGVNYLI